MTATNKLVREARKKRRLSQQEAAALMGLTRSGYTAFESAPNPTVESLAAFAKALGLNLVLGFDFPDATRTRATVGGVEWFDPVDLFAADPHGMSQRIAAALTDDYSTQNVLAALIEAGNPVHDADIWEAIRDAAHAVGNPVDIDHQDGPRAVPTDWAKQAAASVMVMLGGAVTAARCAEHKGRAAGPDLSAVEPLAKLAWCVLPGDIDVTDPAPRIEELKARLVGNHAGIRRWVRAGQPCRAEALSLISPREGEKPHHLGDNHPVWFDYYDSVRATAEKVANRLGLAPDMGGAPQT